MKIAIFDLSRKQIFAVIILCSVTVISWTAVYMIEGSHEHLTVSFLDVGQGDAIFIESPSGFQLLIDGGPNKEVLRELGSVMPFWDRSINMVITTHPDLDHIGGVPAVLERFDVKHLIIPGVGAQTGAYAELISTAERRLIDTRLARRNRLILDYNEGIYLDILFPDRDVFGVDQNLGSIVAKLTYGETSFLFTGDTPETIESYLISTDTNYLDVDVLKLAHHGSDTSTSLEFLGYTSPDLAIVSAGEDNRYGHPHEEVLARLARFDISYKNTATDGRVVLESDGETIYERDK